MEFGRGRGWHTCRAEFGCEQAQKCSLSVRSGWLWVCQAVELSGLEAWAVGAVGPVQMGVQMMGVQSPAAWAWTV